MLIEEKNYPFRFIAFASLFFAAIFIIENLNHRFWLNDFKVYYSAAQAFLNGEKIYGVPFGLETGFYKYSPFVLLLFTPDSLLPYEAAAIIHFIALSASAIACILVMNKILGRYVFQKQHEKENLLMSAAIVCIAIHLVRELHLGNVNVIILLLLAYALLFMLEEKYSLSGILIAFAVLLKPYFLVVLIPVILFRKWKVCLWFVSGLVLSDIICALVFGYEKHLVLYSEWLESVSAHGSYLQSSHTIQSLLQNYFNAHLNNFSLVIIAAVAVLFAILLIAAQSRHKKETSGAAKNTILTAGYFSLIAIVPNLVITDTEHFLLSLPLIMILLYFISLRQNKFLAIIFLVVIFFFGANSTDLLGKALSLKFDTLGLLGISNLILISAVTCLFLFSHKTIKQ
ncbi:MAG TPA: glycosyltransferase family 87 protein [Bacteroidia bacterium]|nr:glycosyltransferase family 87 protein [Bacteroidia bacterium]